MSEYKLAPVEPTDEMVSAAEDAYMPFGDMELAIRMALLAAPAVQGEPDVSALVEALEASTHRLHEQADGEDDCRCSQCRFVRLRDAALAAHRKQGGV